MTQFASSSRPGMQALPERALPYLALAGSVATFCVGTSFAKHLFPLVGAEATTAYRVGFSALMLLLFFRPWRLPITRASLMAIMRYGAALGMMNLCFYMAIRTIPLGLAIAIEFMGPLTVSLIHSRRPSHFAMVGLAFAGLALLLPIRATDHALDPTGVLFAMGAGVCWGLYIIFGKRTAHLPAGQAVALGMATAAMVVVPVGVANAGARADRHGSGHCAAVQRDPLFAGNGRVETHSGQQFRRVAQRRTGGWRDRRRAAAGRTADRCAVGGGASGRRGVDRHDIDR